MNNTLNKQCQIEDLHISFKHQQGEKSSLTPIKFPKYLKKLKAMTLENVWHKEFTETLFDMASQKRLKKLSLSFVGGLMMPSFSEALAKFTGLASLKLAKLNYAMINQSIFLDQLQTSQSLTSLHLDAIELTDEQYRQLLASLKLSDSLVQLTLSRMALDSEYKQNLFNSFLSSSRTLKGVYLDTNRLPSLEVLSQMFVNKSLHTLEIVNQNLVKNPHDSISAD